MKLELAFDGACEFKMPHVTQAETQTVTPKVFANSAEGLL